MSAQIIELYKYGQITRVEVEGKHCYDTAVTVRHEMDHLERLMRALVIENVEIRERQK